MRIRSAPARDACLHGSSMRKQHRNGGRLEQGERDAAEQALAPLRMTVGARHDEVAVVLRDPRNQGLARGFVRVAEVLREVHIDRVSCQHQIDVGNRGAGLRRAGRIRRRDMQHRHAFCGFQQRHGVVHRARRFAAAVPRNHDRFARGAQRARVRQDEHRPAGRHDDLFEKASAQGGVVVVGSGLAGDEQIGVAAAAHDRLFGMEVERDPLAVHAHAPQGVMESRFGRRLLAPQRVAVFAVVRGAARDREAGAHVRRERRIQADEVSVEPSRERQREIQSCCCAVVRVEIGEHGLVLHGGLRWGKWRGVAWRGVACAARRACLVAMLSPDAGEYLTYIKS
ncbi:hypothetical protein PT2222_150253 [Paraburkholderia tropica]